MLQVPWPDIPRHRRGCVPSHPTLGPAHLPQDGVILEERNEMSWSEGLCYPLGVLQSHLVQKPGAV